MIRLSSSSPVTASTRSGGRAIPARSSTCDLGRVAEHATWPNSSSSCSKRSRRCSMSVTSCPISTSERATFAPTLPPPAMIDVHQPRHLLGTARLARAHGVGERRDRRLRRADGAQPELRVELGARRIEHADDDAVDAVALLRHLADDEVRVVAVGRDDGRIGLGGARLLEDLLVHPVADDEAALPGAEARERLLVLVDARHVPALLGELLRDRRADPPATDDHACHDGRQRSRPRTRPRGTRRRAPRTVHCGARSRPSARRTATGAASAARSRARSGRRRARAASSTIAWPIERARIVSVLDLDAVLLAERARLGERRLRLLAATSSGSAPSSGNSRGTRRRRPPRRSRSRSFASATAVATISSPMSPSFIGTSTL